MSYNIEEFDDDWVSSDDPYYENFDADEELPEVEDPDDWHDM